MKKSYEAHMILAVLSLFITACGTKSLSAQTEEYSPQKSVPFEVVLGKPVTDDAVTEFIVNNNCSPAEQFQLCKDAGIALWADSDQIVTTIYLYSGGTDGFKRYRGELPFGLTFYDPMWRVQEKLRDLNADGSLHQAGLPDEASSPDLIHYWAIYKRFGMTIIYNSPFADEDAYIYAIVVNKEILFMKGTPLSTGL
jgi:hypothetical protein